MRMDIIDVFYLIYLIMMCTTGTLIIIKALKVKLTNVAFFGLLIVFNGLASIPGILNLTYITPIFRNIGFLFLMLFTQKTFYENKKSPFSIFLICIIIAASTTIIIEIITLFIIDDVIMFIGDISLATSMLITFTWCAYASLISYREVKLLDIEPHNKKRYQILGIVAFINNIPATIYLLRAPLGVVLHTDLIPLVFLGFLITSMIAIFFYYILWFMPTSVKNYFNKGYTSKKSGTDEELSEEDLMKNIKEEIDK